MSSLWKDHRTPHFVACITVCDGNRLLQLKKTTGTSNRELAKQIAIKLEQAGRGQLKSQAITSFLETEVEDLKTRRVAHRAFHDVLRRATGHGLASNTVKGYVESWIQRTKNEVSQTTWVKYDQTTKLFLASLGTKAEKDISELTRIDIAHFRDNEVKRVSPTTVNVALKIVRVMLGAAEADGAVTRNEAKHVKILKIRGAKSARRPFTIAELRQVLAQCNDEWRSLVLFGFYTGARLGDLATLTWENIDLAAKELRFTTGKTDRRVSIPLAEQLRIHIEKMPAGDDPKQPLHPTAFAIVRREGRTGTLSRQFGEILASAGLAKARSHHPKEQEKKGRSARRETSDISFHALRHTAVSLLKNAGVSDAVAQDLVGHESAEVSRLYTHIEDKTKREAVNKLPAL